MYACIVITYNSKLMLILPWCTSDTIRDHSEIIMGAGEHDGQYCLPPPTPRSGISPNLGVPLQSLVKFGHLQQFFFFKYTRST